MKKEIILKEPIDYNDEIVYQQHEVEKAFRLSMHQLEKARLFSSRYDYYKTLNKNMSYLEVGVAWGHSAQMFIDMTNAKSADLVDFYDNAAGIFQSNNYKPKNNSETHEEYIKNKFSYHPNVNTLKGDARNILPTLNKKYDFIFLDMEGERFLIRKFLQNCSKIINDGGTIGITSYTNHTFLYDEKIGVYQSVNEFLHFNQDWYVDAIILEPLAFHDIYIKKSIKN